MEKGINMSVNICNIFRILNLDGDGDIEKYLKFVGVGEPFKNKWLPCVRDRESWMIVSPLRNSTPDSPPHGARITYTQGYGAVI